MNVKNKKGVRKVRAVGRSGKLVSSGNGYRSSVDSSVFTGNVNKDILKVRK